MSRTRRTDPLKIQVEKHGAGWFRWGGAFRGVGHLARTINRRDRFVARRELRSGEQPAGVQPRSRARFEVW